MLRGRALEIVDERGKVRPSCASSRGPEAQAAERRSLSRDGAPPPNRPERAAVGKLATDVRGGGLYLGGAEDPTMARLGAEGAEAQLELVNKDRQEKVIRP